MTELDKKLLGTIALSTTTGVLTQLILNSKIGNLNMKKMAMTVLVTVAVIGAMNRLPQTRGLILG